MQQDTSVPSAGQTEIALVTPSTDTVATPASEVPCSTCAGAGTSVPGYVYAIGRMEARFPRLSVEKEFSQATGRAETAGQTDHDAFHTVLSRPENRYLARHLCWVLTVQGLDTYIVQPRVPGDLDRLVEAIRPQPSPLDVDIVIGIRGPIAPPDACNGLMVPVVLFDQVYSFDRHALIKAIPRPDKMTDKQFAGVAAEVFDRILQMTDNAGATDEHRAVNYLVMRYPGIYAKAAEAFARDFSLTAVEVLPSTLSSTRRICDVIVSFTNRNTDFTEKSFVRVDVTEEFRAERRIDCAARWRPACHCAWGGASTSTPTASSTSRTGPTPVSSACSRARSSRRSRTSSGRRPFADRPASACPSVGSAEAVSSAPMASSKGTSTMGARRRRRACAALGASIRARRRARRGGVWSIGTTRTAARRTARRRCCSRRFAAGRRCVSHGDSRQTARRSGRLRSSTPSIPCSSP